MIRRMTVMAVALLAAMAMAVPTAAAGNGAMQFRGLGEFDGVPGMAGECSFDDIGDFDADAAILIGGDLEGCLYQDWGPGVFRPSGTYYETGIELFVGCLGDLCGSFETTYVFTGKYGDPENFAEQKFGRCQHPIVAGTGTGDFEGATGRLDFKDDVEAGNFPLRGHIRLP